MGRGEDTRAWSEPVKPKCDTMIELCRTLGIQHPPRSCVGEPRNPPNKSTGIDKLSATHARVTITTDHLRREKDMVSSLRPVPVWVLP